MDKMATDESPSQISDKIKDILFAKSAERVDGYRPDVASSLFGDEESEVESEVEGDTEVDAEAETDVEAEADDETELEAQADDEGVPNAVEKSTAKIY